MTVEPLRKVRNHFSDVIDRVEHEHERVTVARNGRPVAVTLSPDDLAVLEAVATAVIDFLTGALVENSTGWASDCAQTSRRPLGPAWHSSSRVPHQRGRA